MIRIPPVPRARDGRARGGCSVGRRGGRGRGARGVVVREAPPPLASVSEAYREGVCGRAVATPAALDVEGGPVVGRGPWIARADAGAVSG